MVMESEELKVWEKMNPEDGWDPEPDPELTQEDDDGESDTGLGALRIMG